MCCHVFRSAFRFLFPEGDLVLQGGTRLKRRLLQQLNWQAGHLAEH